MAEMARCTSRWRLPLLGLLLISEGSCASEDAALARSLTAPTPLCPEQYYRDSDLVLRCGKQDEAAAKVLLHASETMNWSLPGGLRDPVLMVSADRRVALVAVDPETGRTILNTSRLRHGSAHWPKMEGGELQDDSVALNVTQHRGNQVSPRMSGSASEGDASLPQVSMSVKGQLPQPLLLQVTSLADKSTVAGVILRYSGFEDCPDVPAGCARYNGTSTRDVVYTWSAWASAKFPDVSAAWEALCQGVLEQGGIGNSLEVPYHLWSRIWQKWPGADQKEQSQWQSVFKYIGSLDVDDGVVSKAEFGKALDMAGVGLSVFTWCTYMHSGFRDAEDAWVALGNKSIDFDSWERTWSSFVPLDHFKKADPEDTFAFVDVGGHGVVSQREFNSVWGMCHNGYHQPLPSTSTVTTTPPTTAASSSTATSTPTVTATSTSTLAPAPLPEVEEADSEPSPAPTPEPTMEPTTEHSTTASGRRRDAVGPTTPAVCCEELQADCLACQTGVSLEQFCKTAAFKHTPGCPTVHRAPAPGDPFAFQNAGCPFRGVAYGPPLADHGRDMAKDVAACQERCRTTLGCAYFTFWWLDGACLLQGIDAQWVSAADAVSGPPVCIADVEVRVSDVKFKDLADDQAQFLRAQLAKDLAAAAGLNRASVEDLGGVGEQVSLAGERLALAAGSHMALPPGGTIRNLALSISSTAALERLGSTVTAANISRPEEPGEEAVYVNASVCSECFLLATRFELAAEGENQSEAVVNASTAGQCQQRCRTSGACTHFSFRREKEMCSMLSGPVVPVRDTGSVAGPQACSPLPPVALVAMPGAAVDVTEGEYAGGVWGSVGLAAESFAQGGLAELVCIATVLVLCLGACIFAGVRLAGGGRRQRRRSKDTGDHKYAPLSRQEVDDYDDEENPDAEQEEPGAHEVLPPAFTPPPRDPYITQQLAPPSSSPPSGWFNDGH